jgi:hypothetical protein
MSTLTESGSGTALAKRLERIRMASFGALTMLILQSVIGTAYNLYGTAPTSAKPVDPGSSPLLIIHSILGILLVITAGVLVFRAVQAKSGPVLATSIVGLVAIIGAGIAGSAFTRNGASGASLGMAIAAALAMLCYAANLVIPLGKRQG